MKLILLTQTVSPGQPGRKANYAYHTLPTQPYTNVFNQHMDTVRLLIATKDIHAGEELLGSYSVMNPQENPVEIPQEVSVSFKWFVSLFRNPTDVIKESVRNDAGAVLYGQCEAHDIEIQLCEISELLPTCKSLKDVAAVEGIVDLLLSSHETQHFLVNKDAQILSSNIGAAAMQEAQGTRNAIDMIASNPAIDRFVLPSAIGPQVQIQICDRTLQLIFAGSKSELDFEDYRIIDFYLQLCSKLDEKLTVRSMKSWKVFYHLAPEPQSIQFVVFRSLSLYFGCSGKLPVEIYNDVGNFLLSMLLLSGRIRKAAPNDEVLEYTSFITNPVAMQDLLKKGWYSIFDFCLRQGENTFELFRGSAVDAEELSVFVSAHTRTEATMRDIFGDSGDEDTEENIKRVQCEMQQSFTTSSPSIAVMESSPLPNDPKVMFPLILCCRLRCG